MEERLIHAKNQRGYIARAMVSQTGSGWVAEFIENERDEKGRLIQHRLTRQRGNQRVFKTLNAAANALHKMGFKKFEVRLL